MNDYWNDPPEDEKLPECCNKPMFHNIETDSALDERIKTQKQKLIASACSFACINDWASIHSNPITKPLAEKMLTVSIDALLAASREYFDVVCNIKPQTIPEHFYD
jgi:hypothetical protein